MTWYLHSGSWTRWCDFTLVFLFVCSLARYLSFTLHTTLPLSQNDAAAVWTQLAPARSLLQPFTQPPPSEVQVSRLDRFRFISV